MNAGNPFGRLTPGEPIPGIPAAAWNAFLDLVDSKLRRGTGAADYTSTVIGVQNNTGSPLATRFQVLQVGAPAVTQAENDSEFATSRVLVGGTPGVGFVPAAPVPSAWAVLTEPASAGVIVPATLIGLTPCLVDLTDTSHRYAIPTAGDSTRLVSTPAVTGAAYLLWTDDNFATTGVHWALVIVGVGGIGYTTYGADGIIDGSHDQYVGGTDRVKQFGYVGFNALGASFDLANSKALLSAIPSGGAVNGDTNSYNGLHVLTGAYGSSTHQTAIVKGLTVINDGAGTFNANYSYLSHLTAGGTTGTINTSALYETKAQLTNNILPVLFAGLVGSGGQNIVGSGIPGTGWSDSSGAELYVPGVIGCHDGYYVWQDIDPFGAGPIVSKGAGGTWLGLTFVGGILIQASPGLNPLGVAFGGTGQSTLPPGQLLAGNGTGPVASAGGAEVDGSGDVWFLGEPGKWFRIAMGSF